MRLQAPASANHCKRRTLKPSRQEQSNLESNFVAQSHYLVLDQKLFLALLTKPLMAFLVELQIKIQVGYIERYFEPVSVEFSDATSSDWSLFTTSDEAAFTTESARDSFITVDYSDAFLVPDFNTTYVPESASLRTVCCRMFSNSKPHTRFISAEKGYVMESYPSTQFWNSVQGEKNFKAGQ